MEDALKKEHILSQFFSTLLVERRSKSHQSLGIVGDSNALLTLSLRQVDLDDCNSELFKESNSPTFEGRTIRDRIKSN